MRLHGKILAHDYDERTITVIYQRKKQIIYFQRAMHGQFQKLLIKGFYIALDVKVVKKRYGNQLTVRQVIKIAKPRPRGSKTIYSFHDLQKETRDFINELDAKLFLDFEMSMHPYQKNPRFVQEIIQAGYILEDKDGNVLEEFGAYIKPTKHKKLSKRTTKFLELTQKDVDNGIDFKTFYIRLRQILETYRPAIIVWGKNDHLALKDSYKVNNLKSLGRLTRFVNLLKIHKNYFNYKNDIGLKNAYEMYGNSIKTQRHDALEDAYMTKRVFEEFKALLNREKKDL